MIIYFTAIGVALCGLLLHWLKKWLRFQTFDNFFQYMRVNPKHTISTLFSLIGSVSVLVSNGLIDINDAGNIGTLVMTGYSIDSVVNKGSE